MRDRSDAYNSKLFGEVKTIKDSIKSEIKSKSWNISVSPTIYTSKSIEQSYASTIKPNLKR